MIDYGSRMITYNKINIHQADINRFLKGIIKKKSRRTFTESRPEDEETENRRRYEK